MPKSLHFTAHEAKAAQEGRLSQVRRILKPQPFSSDAAPPGFFGITSYFCFDTNTEKQLIKIPYAIGELVPVKEAYYDCADGTTYRAESPDYAPLQHWLDAKAMPEFLSRLTARITDVRVQRVQGLSEADAMAMGGLSEQYDSNEEIPVGYCHEQDLSHRKGEAWFETPVESFRDLWNTTHGTGAWERNDWVYALTLDLIHKNIKEL